MPPPEDPVNPAPDPEQTKKIMEEEIKKDQVPVEGEITQPEAAPSNPQPEPPKSMTIRDTSVTSFMDPNLYIQMKAMANDFIKSKAIPECWDSPESVLVGFQTGLEMGMKPMEAMNSLYFVKGAINVWGKATTRRLKEHGYRIEYSDESPEAVTATVTKYKIAPGMFIDPKNASQLDESYTETFTFKEAEESSYTKDSSGRLKVGWRPGMNRKKKLRYGVLALIINTYIPEVLGSAMGIQELADDYDLVYDKKPKQLGDPSADRKAKMLAAEAKHKEQTKKPFTPKPLDKKPEPEN